MYKKLTSCICCENNSLFEILDLGTQPPANSFHTKDVILSSYELKLMGCDNCWHTQLSVAVNPAELFKNYLYVSGTSQTLKEYFDWFAKEYDIKSSSSRPSRILDIACNDGTQLDSFKKLGWETWGVDPAENLNAISSEKGHRIICEFWNLTVANTLPTFDIIVAQNVFAHTADLPEFLQACKLVMSADSKLVIQTSQANMFENNEFDTIYHEHISFFSTLSMKTVCERNGLFLNNVYKTDIHGTSYIFEIGTDLAPNENVQLHLDEERYRYSTSFFAYYKNSAMACLHDLKNFVTQQKQLGKKVIGYGAAAKGMTVLNAGSIDLDFIIDDNPLKQGLLTPGMNIPIYSSECLHYIDHPVVFIPLAWNFYDEIVERVKMLRSDIKDLFVRYFPAFDTIFI